MPLRIEIDHAACRVRQIATDPLALPSDVFGALDEQAAAGAWAYATIADYSSLQTVPQAWQLRAFLDHVAQLSRTHGRRGPVAFVVPDNLALFGMLRMYSLIAEPHVATVQAFPTLAEAEAWLAEQR